MCGTRTDGAGTGIGTRTGAGTGTCSGGTETGTSGTGGMFTGGIITGGTGTELSTLDTQVKKGRWSVWLVLQRPPGNFGQVLTLVINRRGVAGAVLQTPTPS